MPVPVSPADQAAALRRTARGIGVLGLAFAVAGVVLLASGHVGYGAASLVLALFDGAVSAMCVAGARRSQP